MNEQQGHSQPTPASAPFSPAASILEVSKPSTQVLAKERQARSRVLVKRPLAFN